MYNFNCTISKLTNPDTKCISKSVTKYVWSCGKQWWPIIETVFCNLQLENYRGHCCRVFINVQLTLCRVAEHSIGNHHQSYTGYITGYSQHYINIMVCSLWYRKWAAWTLSVVDTRYSTQTQIIMTGSFFTWGYLLSYVTPAVIVIIIVTMPLFWRGLLIGFTYSKFCKVDEMISKSSYINLIYCFYLEKTYATN